MKRNRLIAILAALGAASVLYAGQGTGPGDCGNGAESGVTAQYPAAAAPEMMRGRHGTGVRGRGMHRGERGHLQRMLRTINTRLHITPEQKQKIRAVVREYRQTLKCRHQQRIEARKERGKRMRGRKGTRGVSRFMSAEKFDKAAFKEVVRERWAMQDQRRAERRNARLDLMADTMEKIYDVLTPQQRQKLIELSQKRRGGK